MKSLYILVLLPFTVFAGTATLTWSPATQNEDGSHATISSYEIYRNGTKIATTSALPYVDNTAPAGTDAYTIKSIDSTGVISKPTTPLYVTVSANTVSTVAYDWRHWTDSKGTHAYVWNVGTVPLKVECGDFMVKYDTRNFFYIDPKLVTLTATQTGKLVAVCK